MPKDVLMLTDDEKSAVLADELISWFKLELPYLDWLKELYLKWDADGIRAEIDADFDALYRQYLDIDYNQVLEKAPDSFYETGLLILLTWQELLKEDKRAEFTAVINQKLKLFDAPVRLTPKGLFHKVMPNMAEYDDARDYKAGAKPKPKPLIILLISLLTLFFFLAILFLSNDFLTLPWE